MTPNEIANEAKSLQTPTDLLELINKIRLSEDAQTHRALSLKELALYCNPDSSKVKRFRTFFIPKKSGGKREISAPVSKLDAFLWPLDLILKSVYEPKSCVMGFTYGRSIVDNAKAHLGQNYVLNLDLENFFPSITQGRVWKRLQVAPYNFAPKVASVIAGLCSIKKVNDDGETRYVLPQGAPTSPVLTNIICERLDRRLLGVAKRFNLRYTRYADDITFSSMHNALKIGGEAFQEIKHVIEEQGFAINSKKTRLQKVGERQEVTGLILSEKVNTPRSYVRDLDQILYVWDKWGYEKAYARMMLVKGEKAYRKNGLTTLERVIGGKLDYLKMVKGENDKVYLKYLSLFNRLKKQGAHSDDSLNYVATYTVASFQELFKTDLIFKEEGEHIRASFRLNDVFHPVRITSFASKAISDKGKEKESLYISLCEDENLFWLIHIREPKAAPSTDLILPIKKIIKIWEEKGLAAAIKAEEEARKKQSRAEETKKPTLRAMMMAKYFPELAEIEGEFKDLPSLMDMINHLEEDGETN
ncbi:MAG: RNA-directed DNA polymerase [Bacteroidales bacterium]|nr:RNA-directed DNA polymerase [Bacteroidales bacterium]